MKGRKQQDKLSIQSVVKMQSLVRGFLARKRLQKVYGLRHKRKPASKIEMDPIKVQQQRYKVQLIRESLPDFVFGEPGDIDYEPGLMKEKRLITTL